MIHMYPVCLLLKITLASVKAKNLNMRQYVSMQTNQRIKIQGKKQLNDTIIKYCP